MEKRKKKNNKNKIIIALLLLSAIIFVLVFYFNSKVVLEKKEIIAKLSVGNRSGFDINATALTFGRVRPGSTASRNIDISNDYSFPIEIDLSATGDIKEFLVFDTPIFLEPGENKTITVSTIDPEGKKEGDYNGEVIITIKKKI